MGGRIGEVNEDVVFDCWGFEMSDEKQVGENRWVSLYFLSKVDAPTTIDGFTVSTRDATMKVLPRWDRFCSYALSWKQCPKPWLNHHLMDMPR
jgi:hypothetical protein